MSLITTRNAIVAKLEAVPDRGQVHAYQRYATKQNDFAGLYMDEDKKLLGWFVRRVSTSEKVDSSNNNIEVHRWRIEVMMAIQDGEESELAFDDLIEAARAEFRKDDDLGGVVGSITVDGVTGLQLEESGPAMFAGVLVHHARLLLLTESSIEFVAGELDDFLRANIKTYRSTDPYNPEADPPQTPRSEDQVNLEQS